MTLIDKTGQRVWCTTHRKLHAGKKCPSCRADLTQAKRRHSSLVKLIGTAKQMAEARYA